ncbi:MAG: hypothetical protein JNM27_04170 [Leptospirales bacterium]|nr:hypothetical protein [Leptospirales bacterium]
MKRLIVALRDCRITLLGFLLLCQLLISTACSRTIHGEFGFSPVDRRESEPLERTILLETEFRLGRENLYFYDYQTIWWIYRMESGPYSQGDFLVSLYEDSLTPEPVEVDMRHVDVERQHGVGIIRQRYEPLKPGDYIIRIAQHSHVVDQANFRILPSEDESNTIEEGDSADSGDEILRYSQRPGRI